MSAQAVGESWAYLECGTHSFILKTRYSLANVAIGTNEYSNFTLTPAAEQECLVICLPFLFTMWELQLGWRINVEEACKGVLPK